LAHDIDYWCFAMSLALHCVTALESIPSQMPYLYAGASKSAHRAERQPNANVRLGLVWKGRPTHANDTHRSLPTLATLAPLWSVSDVAFVSLQKGAGEEEVGIWPTQQQPFHLGGAIADFSDSAAILQ